MSSTVINLILQIIAGAIAGNATAAGTLARYRKQQRPRYGFYVDHMIDSFGSLALMGGLATKTLNRITFDGKGGAPTEMDALSLLAEGVNFDFGGFDFGGGSGAQGGGASFRDLFSQFFRGGRGAGRATGVKNSGRSSAMANRSRRESRASPPVTKVDCTVVVTAGVTVASGRIPPLRASRFRFGACSSSASRRASRSSRSCSTLHRLHGLT